MALPFLVGPLPPGFERRVITVRRRRPYVAVEWQGAIVVVVRGEIALEGLSGARRQFGAGDVLTLDGVPLRALHSVGAGPAVLVACGRKAG